VTPVRAPRRELERSSKPRLLETKLCPPTYGARPVLRGRLHERLRLDVGKKLTLIAAPAGYGKTTLLGTWREREADRQPIAWLTVDETDNDPVLFWSYVLEALDRVSTPIDLPAMPEEVGAARIVDLVLPHLVNSLAEQGEVTLVLDDFHRFVSGPSRESIVWFLEHAPQTFHLVISSRSEPALPAAAMRAHGSLLELRAQELGFTAPEADALLNDRLELNLEPEYVTDLVARTEGWPAGLYLAGLSLRMADDRQEFVSRFAQNRHVVDFLVDEVLEAFEPSTQALMLRSSIFESFCGSLCDAVLEQEGSAEALSALSRSNLFLIPLDDRGEWYRYHHLFAQLLRIEREHREPGLGPELHRRAFAWYREKGPIDEAINHAFAAELFPEAGELIAVEWMRHPGRYRARTVHSWLERFPQEYRRGQPALLAVEAWVNSLDGNREQTERVIAALEALPQQDDEPVPHGFGSIEATVATLRGFVSWGDTRTGLEHAQHAAELEGPESPWRSVICCAVGTGLYFSGRFEEAVRWLMESLELAELREQWEIAVASLAFRSLAAGELGRVDQQASLAEQALEIVLERNLDALSGETFVALGASLAARERCDEALPYFERGVTNLRGRRHLCAIGDALVRQVPVLRAAGRPDDAKEAIAEARSVVSSCADPGILEGRLAALERSRSRDANGSDRLSERELTILRMLRGTLSERDIGRELYLSHNTVHSHTKSIYRKLATSSRSEAVRHAREIGLI
jgi:LuxR family transcriptional regulator, maltose regulon positive regulatory protein